MMDKNDKSPVSALTPSVPTDYLAVTEHIARMAEEFDRFNYFYLTQTIERRCIPVITLGNETSDRAVIYVGAHHGAEWLTATCLLRFAGDFCRALRDNIDRYGLDMKRLASERLIYVVPMLNCDGVDLAIHGPGETGPLRQRRIAMNGSDDFTTWQANARGVDLNHNYDAGFREYKRIEKDLGILSGCRSRYAGEYPESEHEVGALCNFIRFNTNIRAGLTLHTQGEVIYSGDTRSAPGALRLGREIARMTGYTLDAPEDEAARYGGMTDWMTSVMHIPCFTVECGRGKNPLPATELDSIYGRIREMLFRFPTLI